MPGEFPTIDRAALIARLAEGRAAGVTVVTPNRRLAQALAREFDERQAAQGLAAWETADILPVGAFVERCYEEARYSEDAAALPQLLAPAQARAIWESVLEGSALLAPAQTAADCADAWRLAHAWRIEGALERFPGNEDTRAFAGWARAFAKRCAKDGFADAAILPDLLLKRDDKRPPKLLVAYGFDLVPPQAADFLRALGAVSCRPGTQESSSMKTAFASARQELEAAAQWARARLAAGAKRIGVVVPDLQQRRKEVARVFSNAMRPGWALPGKQHGAMPFGLSIGEPLAEFPVVAAALGILEITAGEVPFEKASRLMRSPFLRGADTEFAARALLDAELRGTLPPRLTLAKLIGAVRGCTVLRTSLENLYNLHRGVEARENPPHFWARHFSALLEAAGFPGERAPDSGEFQARARFNETLGEFARLAPLTGAMPYRRALRHLGRLCADTVFQPEAPQAPVQVLGILESAGLAFDCLWVGGLTEEAWPLAARANPFLPVALQQKAGIPEAAAETSLALDRRITAGWMGAAREVVLSYPQKEKDRDLLPSPLIAQVPEGKIDFPSLANYRDVLFSSRAVEFLDDGKATPIAATTIRGGTRVLADQAACPFRAFARHRLGAETMEAPAEGLDAMQRGQLLHALMAGIWKELGSSASLTSDLTPIIRKSAAAAVDDLGLEGRFADLEKMRLERLALEWLMVERGRDAFEVVAIEQKRPIAVGGLEFSGRIDRMDRLLEGEMRGTHVLIDYKTGQATPAGWLGPRPDEPQLPLYAIAAQERVSAVAFAKLRTGDMKFAGLSMKEKELPGVKPAKSWSGLVAAWKTALESLASGFAQGDARVDPKKGYATCRYCGLQPLCRVHERLSALAEGEDEAGE
jgi:probable DNA repair protein